MSQQLSTSAAATIYGRLRALMPRRRPHAGGPPALSDEVLRSVGLSRQKTSYLRDLSRKVVDGSLATDVALSR